MREIALADKSSGQPGTALACTLILLGVLAFLPIAAFADATNRELEPSEVVRAFPAEVKVPDPWRHKWITESKTQLWVIDPPGRLIRAASAAEIHTGAGETVALPSSVDVLKSTTFLTGAPDEDLVWLVDRDARSVWRLESGKWLGPWLWGEEIGSACALTRRRLAINTPEHAESSFAILDRGGKVEKRFGERLVPSHPVLEESANSWLLVSLTDGSIVATHQYRPLVRLYDQTGKRSWEKKPESPVLDNLERHRAIGEEAVKVDPRTCCYESKLTLFATDLAASGDRNRFAIRYGLGTVIEEMNTRGELVATLAFHPPDSPWVTLGLAFWKGIWTAVEPRRLTAYGVIVPGGIIGRVEKESGEPLAEAEVSLKTTSGIVVRVVTNDRGVFQIVGPDDASAGQIIARAPGFLAAERDGVLAEITERPFVLHPEPVVCVVVRDDASTLVNDFSIELMRSSTTARGVSMEGGPKTDFTAADGRGCMRAPWSAPFVVRASAKGFATGQARLEELQDELEITLRPEARLELSVLEGTDTVAGVTVLLAEVQAGDRTTTATHDDYVRSSGENGKVEFAGLIPGTAYRASALPPGFLAAGVEIEVQEGDNKAKLELDRGVEMVVRVTDARDQAPIEGANVRVDPRGLKVTSELACSTGADGSCSIFAVPAGHVGVTARAADRSPGLRTISIPRGERTVQVEMSLAPGTRINGLVKGIEMYPDASLKVTASRVRAAVVTVPISSDGRFVIESLPAGSVGFWINEQPSGSNILFEEIVIPADVPRYEVVFELPTPIRVHGRIEKDDAGCGSCTLVLSRIGAEIGKPKVKANVAPDGRYTARVPTRGEYLARAADSISGSVVTEQITIARETEKNFSLGEGVIDVVVTRGGKPAAGASVQCQDASGEAREAATDVSGKAVFRGLPRGRYSLTAAFGGAAASEMVELRSRARAQLRLEDESGMKLRLIDVETGLPVQSSVRVRVVFHDGSAFITAGLFPDADGLLAVPDASANATYVIKAAAYAFKTVRPREFRTDVPLGVGLVPRGRSMNVQVTAAAGAPCSLELRDAAGLPIALSIDQNPGPVPFTIHQAMLNEIESGNYTVLLRTCDGRTLTSPVTLIEGSIRMVVFGAQ